MQVKAGGSNGLKRKLKRWLGIHRKMQRANMRTAAGSGKDFAHLDSLETDFSWLPSQTEPHTEGSRSRIEFEHVRNDREEENVV